MHEQNRYDAIERLHDPIASEFTGAYLLLKNGGNRLDGVTMLKLLGEWVFG
jgi:hypothetical protein